MKIQRYYIYTGMGECRDKNQLPFLSELEFKEFNSIGYSGKLTNGTRINREDYLNSLGKGQFVMDQTKYDNGDFCEEFLIFNITEDVSEKILHLNRNEFTKIGLDIMNLGMDLRQNQLNGSCDKSGNEVLKEYLDNLFIEK